MWAKHLERTEKKMQVLYQFLRNRSQLVFTGLKNESIIEMKNIYRIFVHSQQLY